jgi:hypothetical protein
LLGAAIGVHREARRLRAPRVGSPRDPSGHVARREPGKGPGDAAAGLGLRFVRGRSVDDGTLPRAANAPSGPRPLQPEDAPRPV